MAGTYPDSRLHLLVGYVGYRPVCRGSGYRHESPRGGGGGAFRTWMIVPAPDVPGRDGSVPTQRRKTTASTGLRSGRGHGMSVDATDANASIPPEVQAVRFAAHPWRGRALSVASLPRRCEHRATSVAMPFGGRVANDLPGLQRGHLRRGDSDGLPRWRASLPGEAVTGGEPLPSPATLALSSRASEPAMAENETSTAHAASDSGAGLSE